MTSMQAFNPDLLDQHGLNRQAIFNLTDLPAEVTASLPPPAQDSTAPRQLILIGHAGRRLWAAVQSSGINSADPIDDFTTRTVHQWFAEQYPNNHYRLIYPGPHAIGLQRLGQLAGWHHPSPFMIGIDAEWGSWFAYRAVVVADTAFAPTPASTRASPCPSCGPRTCIASCPGAALGESQFNLGKCVAYRKQTDSLCKATCVARISCPVGDEHRYDDAQLRHSYSISMRMIEQYY